MFGGPYKPLMGSMAEMNYLDVCESTEEVARGLADGSMITDGTKRPDLAIEFCEIIRSIIDS